MIPFIIGGVALAATGYGVAKLLEDDCSYNQDTENETEPFYVDAEDEVIEKYKLAKIQLYNTTLIELRTALAEINNLNKNIAITSLNFEKVVYPFEELTDDIKQSFEKFTNILYNTKDYINSKLDSLDLIIVNESNYEKYSDDEKFLVDNLMKISNLVDKVTQTQTTINKVDISREVKRGFEKIEKIIN